MAVNTTMRTRINDNEGSRPLKYPRQCRRGAAAAFRDLFWFGSDARLSPRACDRHAGLMSR